MCGISGIISNDNQVTSVETLRKMSAALSHRGPDGEFHWRNESGTVGFAHNRLAIIDLTETGRQPMHYMERYTIVYSGEIYNYKEIRDVLQKKGYVFRSTSDTEVILAAYDHFNTECLKEFDGMFSFAIWDEKERTLFAARDRFGEKPFYYYFDEHRLAFASEMKALWAAGIERRPNLKMLFNFLTIAYTDNPNQPEETFFENISKLPPSHFLIYKEGEDELLIERYWDIDVTNINTTISDKDAIDRFEELFRISVSRRLRSDVAIGTSLSGGVDSTSIVATCKSLNADQYSHICFSAIFPGYEKDESANAAKAAAYFGLKQFTVSPTPEDLVKDFHRLTYHQEEPFSSASVYMQYKVYDLASQHGIRVLLDGQGADETIAGYHKYFKWYWQELFRKRKLLSSKELNAARENNIRERFGFRNIVAALVPDFASIFLEKQYLLKAVQQEDLERQFAKDQSKEAYYTLPTIFSLNGILYFNTMIHGLEELLRYADRNSMAHGAEVRLPFLSHELIEFVFSLPAHFKIREGWTKWLLRKSMEKHLPFEIAWRKDKVGFEPPQFLWMQDKHVQESIFEGKRKLVKAGILNQKVLNKKVQPHHANDADQYDWRYWTSAMYL